MDKADSYYANKLLKHVIRVWYERTGQLKTINLIVEDKFKLKQRERQMKALEMLRQNAAECRLEKRNEQLAATFYLKHLLMKIIDEWHLYTQNKALKRFNQAQMLDKFELIKKKLLIKSFFSKWNHRAKIVMSESTKLVIAINFDKKKHLAKGFSAWKAYLKQSLHEKLLNNQADYFLSMRLKTEFYYKWCQAFENETKLKFKNQQALLFWSINIQRTCFGAWLEWRAVKNEKKQRYKWALEQRQVDIMRVCARNFIEYSMDSRSRRHNATRLLKEKKLLDTLDLQAKYFKIWLKNCEFVAAKQTAKVKVDSQKPVFIVETHSLEQTELITGLKMVNSKARPAPRKPSFLIDSIDFNNKCQHNNEVIVNASSSKLIQESKAILLPPSAFTSLPQKSASLNFLNPIQVASNIVTEEVQTVLDIKTTSHLNATNLVSPQGSCSSIDTVNLQVKKKQPHVNENELIDFKKRLENLSIKSEKLK